MALEFQVKLDLEMLAFEEGGKTGVPGGKNPRSKDENKQQTQPTHDAESINQTQATLLGGECCHHCAISATAPPQRDCFLGVVRRHVCFHHLQSLQQGHPCRESL